jgi:hypothetical protein
MGSAQGVDGHRRQRIVVGAAHQGLGGQVKYEFGLCLKHRAPNRLGLAYVAADIANQMLRSRSTIEVTGMDWVKG